MRSTVRMIGGVKTPLNHAGAAKIVMTHDPTTKSYWSTPGHDSPRLRPVRRFTKLAPISPNTAPMGNEMDATKVKSGRNPGDTALSICASTNPVRNPPRVPRHVFPSPNIRFPRQVLPASKGLYPANRTAALFGRYAGSMTQTETRTVYITVFTASTTMVLGCSAVQKEF